MKMLIAAVIILLCTCTGKRPTPRTNMSFPSHHALECSPFGVKDVRFDLIEDEDDEYEVPVLSDADAQDARKRVLANWNSIWMEVYPKVEVLLMDYQYGMTVSELLAQPGNTIYVSFSPPDEDEKFRMEVAIDVKKEHGSHVFGVEFEELKPGDATATF